MSIIHSVKYDIHVGNDTFLQLGKFLGHHHASSTKVILVDENTEQHCLPLIRDRVLMLKDAAVIRMKAGEENKSMATCEMIWKELTSLHADRRTLLVNLGGGVVCDIGGFAASVFLRGIDFVNIPTSLLAMVDSSVGGKTGVNFAGLKNQVGTFTRPASVFISPVWLRTLPERETRSGFAEMIKHALISSHDKWEDTRKHEQLAGIDWIPSIRDSVILKNRIVNADFHDRHKRKTLNFGHTIGHALESLSMEHVPMRHGEAIAFGMIGEIFLSQQIMQFPADSANAVCAFIRQHFGTMPFEADKNKVLEKMMSDKKNESNQVHVVLLKDIGQPVVKPVSTDMIFQALDFIFEHAGNAAIAP